LKEGHGLLPILFNYMDINYYNVKKKKKHPPP